MRRALSIAALAACACQGGTTETIPPPGLVVHVHLDDALDPAAVGGFELVVTHDGGFPAFDPAEVEGLTLSSEDRDGDGENEAVLVWPESFAFAATFSVRLTFEVSAAYSVGLMGRAFDAADLPVAEGATSATVPPGRAEEVDLDVACLVKGCGAKLPPDMGPPDEGEKPDGMPDAGDGGADAGDGGGIVPPSGGDIVSGSATSTDGVYTIHHAVGFGFEPARSTGEAYVIDHLAVPR